MIEGIVAVVGFGLVAWLAVALIKFNRKRLHIIRCAGAAKEEQLEVC